MPGRRALWMVVLMGIFSSWFGCPKPPPVVVAPPGELLRLGIFYGWPSGFNGASSPEQAAAGLAVYQVVVLGGGLQQPDHGDHQATRAIIAQLRGGGAEVYGYIPLGEATGLTVEQIRQQVSAWHAMGVSGIFYDEAGYDYGNTRQRQNDAIKAAQRKGLRVFANAFDPDHLFSNERVDDNLRGVATALRSGDSYLYESFGLRLGQPEPADDRQHKLAKLQAARKLGVRLLGVTTAGQAGDFDEAAWTQVKALARDGALHGVGFGEWQFAAQDGKMPPRSWP